MDSQHTTEGESSGESSFCGGYCFYTVIVGFFSLAFLLYALKGVFNDFKLKRYASFLNDFKTLYNNMMNDRKIALFKELRDSVAPGQKIRLVEVGSGSGANFKYFPSGTRVICVDPNKYFESYLMEEVKKLTNGVVFEEFKVGFAEDMSFLETSSVDVVVCSLVLCSVTNVEKSLAEILRILKPGGRFYFIEHVAEKNTFTLTALAQTTLAPLWWATMECRLRSHAQTLIEKAGFSKVQGEYFQAVEFDNWPIKGFFKHMAFMVKPHYSGYAVK